MNTPPIDTIADGPVTRGAVRLARTMARRLGHRPGRAHLGALRVEFTCARRGCTAKIGVASAVFDGGIHVDLIGPDMLRWCQGEGAPPPVAADDLAVTAW